MGLLLKIKVLIPQANPAKAKLTYIMPWNRNTSLVDYNKIQTNEFKNESNFFKHGKGFI